MSVNSCRHSLNCLSITGQYHSSFGHYKHLIIVFRFCNNPESTGAFEWSDDITQWPV